MLRLFIFFICLFGFSFATLSLWFYGGLRESTIPFELLLVGSQALVLIIFTLIWELFKPKEYITTPGPDVHELEASNEKFYSLFEKSPVPYLTIDQTGAIKSYNLAAVRLFNTTTKDLIGKPFDSLLSPSDNPELGVIYGKLQANFTIAEEDVPIITVDGQERWVLLSVFVYEQSAERLISLVDITEKKLIDQAKSEFVALATHQLRTPISAIRWNVELLERNIRDSASDKAKNYLVKITRNTHRMIALINDFLSVSKLETGTFATSPETFKLGTYLAEIADEFTKTITDKNITLTTTTEPSDLTFTADTRLFHIITSNLLSNAVKYVPADGRIEWGYYVEGSELVFFVHDSGIGIPEAEQARLFTKFFRASNAQAHQTEGTGLGLYVVQQSVEKLGGTIAMNSVENEGTAFTIRLPRQNGLVEIEDQPTVAPPTEVPDGRPGYNS